MEKTLEIELFFNAVLIQPDEAIKESAGGILLADTAQKKAFTGVVISTGPGLYDPTSKSYIPMPVKAGMRVIYNKFSALDLPIDGKKYVLTDAENVRANIGPDIKITALKEAI